VSPLTRAQISTLEIHELPDALALQKMAFITEALLYNNYCLPPLEERYSELQLEFSQKTFLKASLGGTLIGVVRGFVHDSTGFVERLAVHPAYRGRGIGSSLVSALETHLKTSRFELFTGSLSVDNLRLYERIGYKRFAERPLSATIQLVLMEKP
jgi:ribosomal protein S18 acetylase RimI-like enzyme